MRARSEQPLVTRRISEVVPPDETKRWLIRSLFSRGVGLVGGQPKNLKTWIATEFAYAIATAEKALGRFEVDQKGPVLVFFAEDDLGAMRGRFEDVAKARGGTLDEMPVHLIDVPALFLDDADHLRALRATVARIKPRLLILDPFVRLVRRSDENSAAEVSHVLGSLRELQRTFDVAVLLVHHMRKAPSSHVSQQLRGSGDFSAWSDSAVYITRHQDQRLLTIEHRAAASPPPLLVRLEEAPAPHLVIIDATQTRAGDGADPLRAVILERLRITKRPESTLALRNAVKVRKATLVAALEALRAQGLVARTSAGWTLSSKEKSP